MGRSVGVDYHYCDNCSGLLQYPIFDEAEYQKFYEKVQRSEEVGFRSDQVPERHLRKKRNDTEFKWNQLTLLDVESLLPGKRIFEIGPAEGTFLAAFRDRGYTARGVEPLIPYANYARDVFKLDVENGYFDAEFAAREKADMVILDNVLEHLLTPGESLRHIRNMISDNGILYVAVPCAEVASPTNANIAHITLWTRRALAFLLKCSGFHPLAIVKGRPLGMPAEWVSISQACLEPRPIETEVPTLFKAPTFVELSTRWNDMLGRYERARARSEKYGPAYPWLVRLARNVPGARALARKFNV
jgi:2-polyprenyl-3-methyl-5-hydroxy-6-metoxy-1,4-benzoquinol methylase